MLSEFFSSFSCSPSGQGLLSQSALQLNNQEAYAAAGYHSNQGLESVTGRSGQVGGAVHIYNQVHTRFLELTRGPFYGVHVFFTFYLFPFPIFLCPSSVVLPLSTHTFKKIFLLHACLPSHSLNLSTLTPTHFLLFPLSFSSIFLHFHASFSSCPHLLSDAFFSSHLSPYSALSR